MSPNTNDPSAPELVLPSSAKLNIGKGGLPKLDISTDFSEAEIYLHGAHVTHFQKSDEEPVLFLSEQSVFEPGKAIRGGVPVIFPWFGAREGSPSHGFARNSDWDLAGARQLDDGRIRIAFRLPKTAFTQKHWDGFECEYVVKVGEDLQLELNIWGNSTEHGIEFESCLHSYFAVSHIDNVSVAGLKYTNFIDQLDDNAEKFEKDDAIRFDAELDRIYTDSLADIQIIDEGLNRRILIEKRGSASTVVWNPWIAKARRLPDLADEEYERFLCVESGNIGPNKLSVRPGETATLNVTLGTAPL